MNPLELVAKAQEMTGERRKSAPTFQVFQSIDAQLTYLRRVLTGEEPDRSKLKTIVVGTYAVREFEESDPEFATLLEEVQLIAQKLSKGLKL